MTGSRERATGVIKKIFFKKTLPFGFLKLITPLSLRGEEAVFYLKDMLLEPFEKKSLHNGMIMECFVKEKPDDLMQSFVPFRAEELKPLDPAEYSALVIRSVDPRPGGKGLLVCTDVSLTRASVTPDSYAALKLETPLLPGDKCIVRISWREMVETSLSGRVPTAEIVRVVRQEPCMLRQRSASHEKLSSESRSSLSPEKNPNAQDSANEYASDEEATSSAEDRDPPSRRGRCMENEPNRPRCRSVGDRPHYDASGYQSGMCGSRPNYRHMFPFMQFAPYMHSDEFQFHPSMTSSQFYPPTDPAQCFTAMNQTQCQPTMSAAQYQHTAVNSGQWPQPPFSSASRQERRMKMSLREYLDRGGNIF